MDEEIEKIINHIDNGIYILGVAVKGMETYYEMLDDLHLYLRKKGFDARYYEDTDGKKLIATEKKLKKHWTKNEQ